MENSSTTAPSLYLDDETAWLEQTARLVAEGRWQDVDRENLIEYLNDMAKRDYREVKTRLRILLAHLLKWDHQSQARSSSWELTIREQRSELADLLESGTLRNHAASILDMAFKAAVKNAVVETGLPESAFPATCPYDLDKILGEQP